MRSWRDLRLAIRGFAKNPSFALLAVLALALGIGAATIIFSVVDNIALNPFPFIDSQRLMFIQIHDVTSSLPGGRYGFSAPEFLDIAERNQVFDRVVARSFQDVLYRSESGTEQWNGNLVSPNTFDFLGMPALIGRVIQPDDGKPDAPPVFVMRHKFWAERFNSDPSILNRVFVLNGIPRTLVGIMPPRFGWGDADLWIPKAIERVASTPQDRLQYYQLFGHLKPGLSRAQADAQLDALIRQLAPLYVKDYPKAFTVKAITFAEFVVGDYRRMLLIALGAVVLLLLIGCGNIANLLLARAMAREKEFAVQMALGAPRVAVVCRLMVESLLLAIAGAALGWFFAWAGLKVLLKTIPPPAVPPSAVVELNERVLLFAALVAVVTALIFGLAPALYAVRRDTLAILREGGRGVSGGFRQGRLRNSLVVAEVAVSLALLSGAGLLVRSFISLQQVPLGMRPDHLLIVRPALPQARYKDAASLVRFYRPLLARLKASPGVIEAAEVCYVSPFGGLQSQVDVPGRTHVEQWNVLTQLTTGNIFSLLGARILQGRSFDEFETNDGRKVAVVNQTFVNKYLSSGNPIGQQVRLPKMETWPDPVHDPTFEIIGVVADIKNQGFQQPVMPEMFMPYTITGSYYRALMIRTAQNPLAMVNVIRKEIWASDPNVASTLNRTLEDFIEQIQFARPRFILTLVSLFAGLGLVLAAMGVYGVIAYTTAQQTQEIGIRMALGADGAEVLRMVITMGLRLVCFGAGIGLLVTFALSRYLRSQLLEVSPYDPSTLCAVVAVLLLTGVAACWMPARRATRVDPAIALRYE